MQDIFSNLICDAVLCEIFLAIEATPVCVFFKAVETLLAFLKTETLVRKTYFLLDDAFRLVAWRTVDGITTSQSSNASQPFVPWSTTIRTRFGRMSGRSPLAPFRRLDLHLSFRQFVNSKQSTKRRTVQRGLVFYIALEQQTFGVSLNVVVLWRIHLFVSTSKLFSLHEFVVVLCGFLCSCWCIRCSGCELQLPHPSSLDILPLSKSIRLLFAALTIICVALFLDAIKLVCLRWWQCRKEHHLPQHCFSFMKT